jgi:acylphosphatase
VTGPDDPGGSDGSGSSDRTGGADRADGSARPAGSDCSADADRSAASAEADAGAAHRGDTGKAGPTEATIARRWIVRGQVQGVGFRYFTRSVARGLRLVGRVRNRPDGTVEIEVAGDPEKVADLEAWVRQGPPGAAVTAVHQEPITPDPSWDRFDIYR